MKTFVLILMSFLEIYTLILKSCSNNMLNKKLSIRLKSLK